MTITANNARHLFALDQEEFFDLRKKIASAYDEEFGELYDALRYCHSSEEFAFIEKVAEDMLSDERFKEEDSDILNFLFEDDQKGKIRYRTCKKILSLAKENGITVNESLDGFQDFLQECYSNRRNMVWNI